MKFGRSYQMTVTGKSNTEIVFGLPLTLDFNVTHNIFAEANVGDFSIYNLKSSSRSEIQFNQFIKAQQYRVTLRAGYISQTSSGLLGYPASLPVIFTGYSNVAFTERSGPDLITRLNAFDNGDITTSTPATQFPLNASIPPNTSFESAVTQVMSYLLPAKIGTGFVKVTPEPAPIGPRGMALQGTVWTKLQSMAREAAGAKVFIENGVVNMLGQNDTLGGNNLGILRSSTGLLNIPKYTGYTITCSSIFEPALAIGKTVVLDSSDAPTEANGLCKIVAYTHRGTISGVQSGDAISDITLMSATTPLGVNS